MIDMKFMETTELEALESGRWGTISPHSVSAAKALANHVGAEYGLLCHSADAAYEAVLRHFGAGYGDTVIVGETSFPSDSLIAVCVGAAPIFASVCDTCHMPKPGAVEALLSETKNVRCVVADYIPGSSYPLDVLSEICKKNAVPLVLNAGGMLSAKFNGKPLADYADAVLYSLEEGSEIYAGKGGVVATNCKTVSSGAFSYHNCGRNPEDGSSLNMDEIVGGDLRVSEWTAIAAEAVLASGSFNQAEPMKLVKMKGQPVFESAYAKKMTIL